jgi:hypothetical protein
MCIFASSSGVRFGIRVWGTTENKKKVAEFFVAFLAYDTELRVR